MPLTAYTIVHVEPNHEPNEGRIIINNNFDGLNAVVGNIQSASATGSTIVTAGTYTTVSQSFSGVVPIYQVDVRTSAITYSNTGTTPTTIGGISAGSTFNTKTVQEMFDSLLYPYQTPAFTAFARTNLSSTYELGQVVLSGAQTFTWSTSNSGNVSANTISIVQNFSPVTTLVNGGANVGTTAITLTSIFSSATLSTNTLYTISATNSLNSTFSSTIARTWLPRWYYGKFSGSSINPTQLVALPTNALVSNVVNTYYVIPTGATPEYIYFAIPNTLAQPSDFRDSNAGCFGTNWPYAVQGSVAVTNAYGVVITYTVYRFTNPTAGGLNAWLCS